MCCGAVSQCRAGLNGGLLRTGACLPGGAPLGNTTVCSVGRIWGRARLRSADPGEGLAVFAALADARPRWPLQPVAGRGCGTGQYLAAFVCSARIMQTCG